MTPGATVPDAARLVAEMADAIESRGSVDLPHDEIVRHATELARSNLRQWELEDQTRDPRAPDSIVAEAKRAIDELNLSRHHLVEEIDAAIDRSVGQDPTASLATESPGMVMDRLSVLVIRRARMAGGAATDGQLAARLHLVETNLAALCSALDALLQEVNSGRRRFLPYQHLKLYADGRSRPASGSRA